MIKQEKVNLKQSIGEMNSSTLSNLKTSPALVIDPQWVKPTELWIPYSIFFYHRFMTTPYNVDGVNLCITNSQVSIWNDIPVSFLNTNTNSLIFMNIPNFNTVGMDCSSFFGYPTYLQNLGDNELSEGDGDLLYGISYNIVDIHTDDIANLKDVK